MVPTLPINHEHGFYKKCTWCVESVCDAKILDWGVGECQPCQFEWKYIKMYESWIKITLFDILWK